MIVPTFSLDLMSYGSTVFAFLVFVLILDPVFGGFPNCLDLKKGRKLPNAA